MSNLNQLYLACIIVIAIHAVVNIITLKVMYYLIKRTLDEIEKMNTNLEKIADKFNLEECEEIG